MKLENNIIGIIGNPIQHSISPLIHNFWMKKYNIKGCYYPFLVKEENLKNLIIGIRSLNIRGLNVTVPFKEKVIPFLDELDDGAKNLGAINTIVNENGSLKGYNTDKKGFIAPLKNRNNYWDKNKPVLLIGAGGAALSIISALENEGVKEIRVMNRTEKNIDKLVKKYKLIKKTKWLDLKNLSDVGLIINSTSLGMKGFENIDINLKKANNNALVYDIIYNPKTTKLLKEAKKNKLKNINGLEMLIEQAKESFYKWFSIYPDNFKSLSNLISKKLK